MNPTQSNTKYGVISMMTVGLLAGKEGFLAVLKPGGASLPTADTDAPAYIIDYGAEPGQDSQLKPVDTAEQIRVPLVGTCARGDRLVMAPASGDTAGKVTAGTSGTSIGIAEEDGVDGQFVLIRPNLFGVRIA